MIDHDYWASREEDRQDEWAEEQHLRDLSLAWAAGFFDGEGSVSAHIDKRPGRRPGLQLDIEQTDERPLRRFQEAVGHGRISHRAARAVNRKPLFRLHMSDADTRITLAKMWPWLSEPKKEQVARALRVIEESLR